ncbi:MAG TPA: PIG-L family deacetylase, partial [Anaerolineae bacterium]|nr:PIG-L family deacetylase [Anaerolineae bacterium]
MLKNSYDHIYLAPHLDDVALSCGDLIFQQTSANQSVLILTIMAGAPPAHWPFSPFAQHQHQQWGLSAAAAVAQRRQEDINACRLLDADYLHWDIYDCIYRHAPDGRPLYATEEALFATVDPDDTPLQAALTQRLQNLPPHKTLYAPLTIG